MPRLVRLYDEQGQSPWLDNLARPSLWDGTMAELIARGVRGVTANPTIVAKAIESSDAYDPQFHALLSVGHSLEDAYWHLVIADVSDALGMLRPTHDAAGGTDGFVSIEVAPGSAHNTRATITAARELHERIGEPNLLVKIPATSAGVPAIEAMVAEGRSINVTLIFSLTRYRQVLEAYLSGLEPWPATAATCPRSTASPRSSSAGSTPRSTAASRRSARTRPSPCAGERPSPKPSSPTSSSARSILGNGGNGWPTAAHGCNGLSGPPPRPRTPITPTPCTSTA